MDTVKRKNRSLCKKLSPLGLEGVNRSEMVCLKRYSKTMQDNKLRVKSGIENLSSWPVCLAGLQPLVVGHFFAHVVGAMESSVRASEIEADLRADGVKLFRLQ